MVYEVSITARAERDLTILYDEKNVQNSPAALRWYSGLRKAILSLEQFPNRCPVTREVKTLRHLLYGRKPRVYRVIYRVIEREKKVEILHIRHGAMSDLEPGGFE